MTDTMSEALDEKQREREARDFGHRLRDAWHKTVGTWTTDEKTTASLVKRLVDFGTLSSEEAKKVLAEARKRVDENKHELDRRVDESLHKAQALLPGAEARELRKLEERLTTLEARLQALQS